VARSFGIKLDYYTKSIKAQTKQLICKRKNKVVLTVTVEHHLPVTALFNYVF